MDKGSNCEADGRNLDETTKSQIGREQTPVTASDRSSSDELTASEKKEVEKLEKRDRHVRNHEQAHVNAGASNPTYEFKSGPDGKRYAVGGHARIDVSKTGDPEKDIEKAKKVKRAALAPMDPSPQDRRVAAEADQMEREARAELAEEQKREATAGNQSSRGASPVQEKNGGSTLMDGYGLTGGQAASSIDMSI